MDDYETLEPTDVGNMTIDYDTKDDSKIRRIRWDPEEVLCMLNFIKENKFSTKYSAIKMSGFLSDLMAEKGWNRTQRQIHVKISTLRKNYLNYERLKSTEPNLKECAFYRELREIYRDALNSSNGIDVDEDSNSQEETSIKFPSDPIDWTYEEVQKMLNVIKALKVKNELTLTFFSPVAVRMITESMHQAGFDRSTEQVKNALINLRSMYIDYKIGCDNNENPSECLFFPCLDFFWGKEFKKTRSKERRKKNEEFWTTEETIVLLTIIQDLNLASEAYQNIEEVAEELRQNLAENNFLRTAQQIKLKLEQLKLHFNSVHEKCAQGDALKRFPFYNLYKKLFEKEYIKEKNLTIVNKNGSQNSSYESKGKVLPDQDSTWSDDEIRLLLKTVRELTSEAHVNDSLEDEKLKKLIKNFRDHKYYRTAEQIKNKLSELKESYYKCNLEESSEKNVFECPFYNELHDIFQTPVSDEKYEFIQNVLSENVDSNSSKFSDHSYNKFNSIARDSKNNKVTVIPNNNTWFPVESIIEEEVTTSEHFDDTSNTDQEKIEKALRSIIPNKIETEVERQISIAPIPGIKDIIVENNRKPIIAPCTTKIQNEISSDIIMEQSSSMIEEDEVSPSKKPRIIEDEKLAKKILLRPMENKPTIPHLNVTSTKFVRLIVANDQSSTNKINQISAHIEPLCANTASSISSGASSPIERAEMLKITSEKYLSKEDHTSCGANGKCSKNETSLLETIKDAVQSITKHDELLQQRHHAWMEKQFEIQRKHEDEQRQILMNELKELRKVVSVFINNKDTHTDDHNHQI